MKYDFIVGRWAGLRPHGWRWSQFVLGRRKNQRVFIEKGEVLVSAYLTGDGRLFYTDPCCGAPAGRGVLYRVRVKRKAPL